MSLEHTQGRSARDCPGAMPPGALRSTPRRLLPFLSPRPKVNTFSMSASRPLGKRCTGGPRIEIVFTFGGAPWRNLDSEVSPPLAGPFAAEFSSISLNRCELPGQTSDQIKKKSYSPRTGRREAQCCSRAPRVVSDSPHTVDARFAILRELDRLGRSNPRQGITTPVLVGNQDRQKESCNEARNSS